MLQRVMLDGIELPRLYIAENNKDVEVAKENGIPFVKWTQGQDALIKMLLRPVLERMFPFIKWDAVLGRRRRFRTKVMIEDVSEEKKQLDLYDELGDEAATEPPELDNLDDPGVFDLSDVKEEEDGTLTEIADTTTGEHLFDLTGNNEVTYKMLDIEDYIGDMSSYVNIDILQRLRLMPAFIGDILDCVKLNIGNGVYWREGYNKRLGLAVGRFDATRQLPNLIILDVSGSIPRGISATMISLIDTLRSQLSADLIITGSTSRFYPMGCTLPAPQEIRSSFGYGNEAIRFFEILRNHISGKHYGHVFSFGDNDTPTYFAWDAKDKYFPDMVGTIVEHVHHYHTRQKDTMTGYAKWCHMLAKKPEEEYDTSWCNVICR